MERLRTRTYKLRLSPEGIRHFLDCHHRLAVLLGEMIPYGVTLHVAMTLLARTVTGDWLDEADERIASQWKGARTCFVGSSYRIAEMTAGIAAARVADDQPPVPVALLYLLALRCFEMATDHELMDAHPDKCAGAGDKIPE
ncbi:hypothetical protein [Sphingomonas oryzagri]